MREVVIVDIETTGQYGVKYGDKIIEVSAMKIDIDNNFKVTNKYHTFVGHENLKLKPNITDLTGITQQMLLGQPGYNVILKELYDFCLKDNIPLVGHNFKIFDWSKFLEPLLNQYGFYSTCQIIDTLQLSKKLIKGLPKKGGYTQKGLSDYIGIPVRSENLHSAEDDVLVCIEIFKYLFKKSEEIGDPIVFNQMEKKLVRPEILKINKWLKTTNNGKDFKRVYIELKSEVESEKIFYDILNHSWSMKSCSVKNLDTSYLIEQILKHFKVESIEQL